MKRAWQVGNILSLIIALVCNTLIGAQLIGLPGINQISDKYATVLTPASYAFSIWSLIYILLIAFVIYQARDIFKPGRDNDLPERLGPYFITANIANAAWTFLFVKEYVLASVIAIFILVASLFVALYRLKIAVFDAKMQTITLVWWPLLIYTGWVTVAGVVNVMSLLASYGVAVTAPLAVIILILLCFALIYLLFKRSVRELVLASAWGITAIGFNSANGSDIVRTSALTVGSLLVALVLIHGYRNRESNPFYKLATGAK